MRPKQQKKKNNNKNWIIGYQVRNQGDTVQNVEKNSTN